MSSIRSNIWKNSQSGKMYRLVMFDMDGVLFDSMPMHAKAWSRTFEGTGLDYEESKVYLYEGMTASAYVAMLFNIGENDTRCREICARKSEILKSLPEPVAMPGAFEALAAVKETGVPAIVVTGSAHTHMLEKLSRAYPGLLKTEWMVSALDVKRGKPNPDPYLAGAKKAGVAPCDAIVVENAPMGVHAAHAAGCRVIAVNTGPLPDSSLLDEGADFLFHSMSELSENIGEIIEVSSELL